MIEKIKNILNKVWEFTKSVLLIAKNIIYIVLKKIGFFAFVEWSGTWVGTFAIVFFVIFFVAQAFIIPSGSMKNSLLVGDMLFGTKYSYGIPIPRLPWLNVPILPDFFGNGHLIEGERPKRGDIVIFIAPNSTDHYVKRVVAVGGDKIALRDQRILIQLHEGLDYMKTYYGRKQIVSYKNETWVEDPYRYKFEGINNDVNITTIYKEMIEFPPTVIKKDHFFMMGDNRNHSYDSRYWGSVPYSSIIGKPAFIYMSIDFDTMSIRWERIFTFVDEVQHKARKYGTQHKDGVY